MSYTIDDALADYFAELHTADLWSHEGLGWPRDILIGEMARREYEDGYCKKVVTGAYRCLRWTDDNLCPVHGVQPPPPERDAP